MSRLKKIIRFQKSRHRWDLEKLYAQRQRMQDTLEEKLCAIECESGNAEVQWNNIKECMLDTISDSVGKVEKRARKPWITQEDRYTFLIISHSVLLIMKNVSDKSCVKTRNTHFMCSDSFKNRAVYEIMWKILWSRTGHRQYGASALHAGYLRLQTHTHNM